MRVVRRQEHRRIPRKPGPASRCRCRVPLSPPPRFSTCPLLQAVPFARRTNKKPAPAETLTASIIGAEMSLFSTQTYLDLDLRICVELGVRTSARDP
jgi:hypothetical protein